MAKIKSSELSNYELLYIISNEYSEDEAAKIVQKISAIIKDNEGKITFSEEWGKKKLAYPIKHFRHGYYYLVEFDLVGERLANINRALRMLSEILRFQLIKKERRTIDAAKIKPSRTQKKEEPVKARARGKEEKSVDLKDLDEKLDKILETKDLL